MAETSNDNIFSNLKGLIWSAFIGVASFQVLAPTIWGNMHDAVDLPYTCAYAIFTVVYFSAMPVCMLVWMVANRKLMIKYFPPYDKDNKAEKKYSNVLWALGGFILLEWIFAIIAFFHHFPGECLYTILLGVYAIFCILFGSFYALESYKHIKQKTISDSSLYSEIKKSYWQLTILTFLFAGLLFFIGFKYINEWQSDKAKNPYQGSSHSSFAAGLRGFALTDLKDRLDDRYKYLTEIEDSIQYDHFSDTLNSVNSHKFYLLDASHHDSVFINPDKELINYDTAFSSIRKNIISTFDTLRDPSKEVTYTYIQSIASNVTKLKLTSDSLKNTSDDIKYINMLKAFTASVSKETDKKAKAQLALQLKSVQIKGLSLLISLLFYIFSLYIFLRINQKLETTILKKMQDENRITKDSIKEDVVINQENRVEESAKMSGSLWLYLTIIVWLLVPLFKPVKEEDINIKEPYKSPTVSNGDNYSVVNNPQNGSHSNDTVTYNIRLTKIDSLHYADTTSLSKNDLEEIKIKLKAIKEKTDDIESDHQ